jgi:hypothetical protein
MAGYDVSLSEYLILEADLSAGPLATPTYASLGTRLISGAVSRGRSGVGPDDQYGTGTASFVIDNTTHALSTTAWYRGKHIRLKTAAGTAIFTGYIDRVRHDQSGAPFEASATIECVDQRSYKQRATLAGFGYTIPTNGRFVPPGLNVPWQPPDFGADTPSTYDLAELVRQWVDNECGAYIVTAAGAATSFDRWWRLRSLEVGAVQTFAEDPGVGEIGILARSSGGLLELSEPEETYRDRAEFTGTSTITQISENVPVDYDATALSRVTQCPDDNWMAANALYQRSVYESQAPYWRRFTVRAAPSDTFESAALVELGDVVDVAATPVGSTELACSLFVESVEHRFAADPPLWDVTFGCSNAQAWFDALGFFSGYLVYDNSMSYDDGLLWAP